MKIYILTWEPYHDNSRITGVYPTEEAGLAALRAAPNPANINEEDYLLTEWDVDANRGLRRWRMHGTQVWVDGRPVRKEFTFVGPEGDR